MQDSPSDWTVFAPVSTCIQNAAEVVRMYVTAYDNPSPQAIVERAAFIYGFRLSNGPVVGGYPSIDNAEQIEL